MSNFSKLPYNISLLYLSCLLLLAIFAEKLPLPAPLILNLSQSLHSPSSENIAGTDQLGRDIFSRLIFASRSTLVIFISATLLSITLGTVLGVIAGYLGGWWRKSVDFFIDLFWSVPFVIFVLLIVALFGANKLILILSIGGINWVTSARIIRDATASLKKRGFILALRAFGYSKRQIVFPHLPPNLKATLLSLTAYAAVEALSLETGLAFLGMSLPPPQPTWGGLLADSLAYFSTAWWMVMAPTLTIILTVGSLHILARHHEKFAINLGR